MEAKQLIYEYKTKRLWQINARVYTHVFVLQILTQNESENRGTIGRKTLDYMG